MGYGWDKENQLDMDCWSNDFQKFVQNVLMRYPGCYSKRIQDMLGVRQTDADVSFIGKYENLLDDLLKALILAGETF